MTDVDIMDWIHEEEDDNNDKITCFEVFIIVGMIVIITIWDFITSIPKAIANCFIADVIKEGMIPMAEIPKQTLPETDETVFESAFFRLINRVTDFFTKVKDFVHGSPWSF